MAWRPRQSSRSHISALLPLPHFAELEPLRHIRSLPVQDARGMVPAHERLDRGNVTVVAVAGANTGGGLRERLAGCVAEGEVVASSAERVVVHAAALSVRC
jgi:hypothetical protein